MLCGGLLSMALEQFDNLKYHLAMIGPWYSQDPADF